MPAIQPRAEIDRYGLPAWLAGWVRADGSGRRVAIRALLDGREIGATHAEGASDESGRTGFTIHFAEGLPPGVIASGRLTLRGTFEDATDEPIACSQFLTGIDAIAGAMATITAFKAAMGEAFGAVIDTLPTMFPDRIAPLFPPAPPPPVEAATAPVKLGRDGASPVHLPVGLVARAGDAILGRKGFVFSRRGLGGTFEAYAVAADDAAMLGCAEAWKARIGGRVAEASARGIGFVQTIVPQKTSVLPDHLPSDVVLTAPTPLLAAIEQRLGSAGLRRHYVSALALLQAGEERAQVFRRVDTHLTPFGAYRLARDLARQLGHPVAARDIFGRVVFATADLGDRFFDVPLLDQLNEAVPWGPQPARIAETVPEGGGPLGGRQVWRNPVAPVGKRLVVFGDSFTNLADAGQGYLAHWLTRWFAEVHLVWDEACDWSLVDAVKPDLLLCQTCERALDAVPPA